MPKDKYNEFLHAKIAVATDVVLAYHPPKKKQNSKKGKRRAPRH